MSVYMSLKASVIVLATIIIRSLDIQLQVQHYEPEILIKMLKFPFLFRWEKCYCKADNLVASF